jgi:NADH dehydrogenase
MEQKIVIIGSGFSGLWSALSARRLISMHKKDEQIKVIVVAPEPSCVMRPRLYESDAATLKAPLDELFQLTGVQFIQGYVENIDSDKQSIRVASSDGKQSGFTYDRLILAAGSQVARPKGVAGLAEHAFDIDSMEGATKLESHLKKLAQLPPSAARDTVVVGGAGFTGIELATELPARLRALWGATSTPKVVLVGNNSNVGPELGPGPRPVILQALQELGVQLKLGSAVVSVDSDGVTTANGERIESLTTVWTAGVKATPLTQQIPAKKDSFGRLHVDENLRVPDIKTIFATGDAACANTGDDESHSAMMSCQHAQFLGRSSGHNAAADLLGEPNKPYSQPTYGTCLDLGAFGAVVTKGWDREVMYSGQAAKRVKNQINQVLIYPPKTAEEAFTYADLEAPDGVESLRQLAESAA